MTTFLWLYVLMGTLYMLFEFRIFSNEELEEDVPAISKWLYFVQMVNHLFRVFVVWPTYVAEDIILFACKLAEADEEDIDGP